MIQNKTVEQTVEKLLNAWCDDPWPDMEKTISWINDWAHAVKNNFTIDENDWDSVIDCVDEESSRITISGGDGSWGETLIHELKIIRYGKDYNKCNEAYENMLKMEERQYKMTGASFDTAAIQFEQESKIHFNTLSIEFDNLLNRDVLNYTLKQNLTEMQILYVKYEAFLTRSDKLIPRIHNTRSRYKIEVYEYKARSYMEILKKQIDIIQFQNNLEHVDMFLESVLNNLDDKIILTDYWESVLESTINLTNNN